jgi:dynein heavy chain
MIPGADPPIYSRVRDFDELQRVVEEALEDYNSVSNAPMKLVMVRRCRLKRVYSSM